MLGSTPWTGPVAGVDEVGRGPWAGPVLAAAVILDHDRLPASLSAMIDDSKKLDARTRREIAAALPDCAAIGVGLATVAEIDRLNILQAALLAMGRAVAALPVQPALALIDGNRAPALPCPARTIVGGDASELAIAAASIVAKVTRDALMTALDAACPGYAWDRNMGYGTAEHRRALRRLGVTPHHRRSFRPIRELLAAAGIPAAAHVAPTASCDAHPGNGLDPTAGKRAHLCHDQG
jgi:ribonuclease HII